ncbi:MAG: histidine kinase, partial [Bacteroidota bacterium]
MKQLITIFLCCLVYSSVFSQEHIIDGPVQLRLHVIKKGKHYNIDSLCAGYDEYGVPQNLVIPSGSSLVIDASNRKDNEVYNYYSSGKKTTFNSDLFFHRSASDGAIDTIDISNVTNGGGIRLIWKTDYRKPRLIGLIPADEPGILLDLAFSGLFTDHPDTSFTDWDSKEYITSVDKYGVPHNPVFPNDVNGFIFVPDFVDEGFEIQMIGLNKEPQLIGEAEASSPLAYKDLPPGAYEFVLKPFQGAPEAYTLRYPFTIGPYWWMTASGIIGIAFAATILLGALFFLGYRRRVHKERREIEWQKQLAHSELKAIRSQLNPHFMFNALNAIQNLVSKGENVQANQYITKLSKLMRMVLDQSGSGFHDLYAELDNVTHYLELEKLRMPFRYEINVGDGVSKDTLVPALLLQPFVENAVIHGIFGKTDGEITVDIKVSNGQMIFKVKDNGRGLTADNAENSGLRLSKSRVEYLNKIYQGGASITINNREEKTGVVVT